MTWMLGVIAVAIIATGVFLASGRFGEMPDLVDDQPTPRLPDGDFTAKDIQQLHFARAVRGYAPHQVDELLVRCQDEIDSPTPRRRPTTRADIETSVFDVVGNGYHMGQVDHVLDLLAGQLDRRHAQRFTDDAPAPVQAGSVASDAQAPAATTDAE